MFKYNNILILSLFAALFFSCSEENGEIRGPEEIGEGYSQMRVDIRKGAPDTPTYAEVEEPAFTQEKTIESVAFFTQCGDKGTPGQAGFRAGAFGKFFSTEDLRTPYGLYEPLDETTGGYMTTIQVKSDAFEGPTKVIVIANYRANGLTEALKAVERWEDLEKVRTKALTNANLETPLLMYGFDDQVNLSSGSSVDVKFNLKRIVSRIDVVNRAYNEQEPEKGFVLESAQLILPRQYSYLLPGNTLRHDIPTIASLPLMYSNNAPTYDKNQIVGMYLYETDNDVDGRKTKVKVDGKLFNTPFSRVVELKLPDESDVKPGDPIAMLRNHLYRVVISPLVSEDVELNTEVVDWTSGTELFVKPTPEKPAFSAFTATNLSGNTTWDETNKVLVYDGTENEELRFTVTAAQATLYDFTCELDPRGLSLGLNNPNSDPYRNLIKPGKPKVTYASVTQDYVITVPTVLSQEHTVPVDIKIYLRNEANPNMVDSITVRCRPNYLDSPYQPVKVGDVFFAPLNVGATTTDATILNTASTGYFYQFGRNVPFKSEDSPHPTMSVTSYKEAIKVENQKKFIISSGDPWDWITTTDSDRTIRNNAWQKENNTLCPKGWKIGNLSELQEAYNKPHTYPGQNRMLISIDLPNEPGKQLYFPLAGYIHWKDGTIYRSGYGYIWGNNTDNKAGNLFYFSSTASPYKWIGNYGSLANGFSIRCVQDTSYGLPKP